MVTKTLQEMQKELAELKVLYKHSIEKIDNCNKALQSSVSPTPSIIKQNNERTNAIKERDNLAEKIVDLKLDIIRMS